MGKYIDTKRCKSMKDLEQGWPIHGVCATSDMDSCCVGYMNPGCSVKGGTRIEAGGQFQAM